MSDTDPKERERNKTRRRAARIHQGPGRWHVEKRSKIVICRNCEAQIPIWKNPAFCPDCGAGHSELGRLVW